MREHVDAHDLPGRVIISTFDAEATRAVRAALRGAPVGDDE